MDGVRRDAEVVLDVDDMKSLLGDRKYVICEIKNGELISELPPCSMDREDYDD